MKDKNHMIISTDAEKAFDKIQHPFIIETLSKVGIEGTYLHAWQTHWQHYIQWAKTISVPLKIRNETGMSAFTSHIQHSTGSPSHSNQIRRINKRHPNCKAGSKTVIICRWHDIVHRDPKDSTKKLPELINEFSKVAGYKINIQKSVAFWYAHNKLIEREIKKKNPIHNCYKKINKIPRNTPNQDYKRPVLSEL